MSKNNIKPHRQIILEGVETAIAQALEHHRRLGQSIAVWQDGKVVILEADQIPLSPEPHLNSPDIEEGEHC